MDENKEFLEKPLPLGKESTKDPEVLPISPNEVSNIPISRPRSPSLSQSRGGERSMIGIIMMNIFMGIISFIGLFIFLASILTNLFLSTGIGNILQIIGIGNYFGSGIINLILGIYIFVKYERDQGQIDRNLYVGDFEEERAVGRFLGTFSVKIGTRKLYGINVLSDRYIIQLILLWGHPDICTTFIKNHRGKTIRQVLRGKIVPSLSKAILEGFFDTNRPLTKDENIYFHEIENQIAGYKLGSAIWINPYGNQQVEEFFSDDGLNSIPDLKLEQIKYATKLTQKIDDYRKMNNRMVYTLISKIFPLYQNALRMYPPVIDVVSGVLGAEANKLERLGIMETIKGAPDQITDLVKHLDQYKTQLNNLFGGGADDATTQAIINTLSDMSRKVASLEARQVMNSSQQTG